MAPKQLPGLYWDDDRKRYFPLASRPAGTPSRPPAPHEARVATLPPGQPQFNPSRPSRGRMRSRSPPRKRRQPQQKEEEDSEEIFPTASTRPRNVWQSLNSFREAPLGIHRRTCVHDIQITKLSTPATDSKRRSAQVQFSGPVTALCAKGSGKLLVGDATGWLYSVRIDEPDVRTREFEFGLRTQITSITRSGSVCMYVDGWSLDDEHHLAFDQRMEAEGCALDVRVTSLGSPAKLLITREDSMGLWILRDLPPTVCSDVWCGQVRDRKAVVGGREAVVCFPDVERDAYVRLPRFSDVLTLYQYNENITLMGMRNGVVDRWDSREPGIKTDLVVNMAESPSPWTTTPTIDYLRVVRGHELLVRTMRGDLETHDLRFLRRNMPLLQFPGFLPSFASKLGITVDSGEDFVFSGGGDKFLHIWSLRTGEALPARDEDRVVEFPGSHVKVHIRALEIVESDSRVTLWMGFAKRLDRVVLGPKGLLL